MSDPKNLKGVAVRDFSDAGTGANFIAGKSYEIEAGAHGNYLEAGLITVPDDKPSEPKAGTKPA